MASACLDNVIKVAGERASSSTRTRQVGVGANGGIDFFAKDTTNDSQEGNSFAAPRIASAYALLHKLFPASSVTQKTEALNQAATLTDSYQTRLVNGQSFTYRARKIREDQLAEAINYLSILFPSPSGPEFNIVDNSSYGPYYDGNTSEYSVTFNFDLETSSSKLPSGNEQINLGTGSDAPSLSRDVELNFTGIFGRGTSLNEFILEINGQRVERFDRFPFDSPSARSFIINRNLFNNTGDNTVVLRPNRANANWGIEGVSMNFLPVVPLTIGVTDTNIYGYQQNPTRFTGLRASFDVPEIQNDYILSVTGWDMDLADENEVFLNGTSLGHLTQGAGSSQYSPRDNIILRASRLIPGKNTIEFVQRQPDSSWNGFEREKWAVKDILIQPALPDLAVTFVNIRDTRLETNVPFQATTNISNLGAGSSGVASNVRFYASLDNQISSSDTVLATVAFAPLLENRSREVSTNIQTSLVNQGYYFGACVDRVPTESITGNNCSKGIRLATDPSVTPIFLLLLGD